MPPSDAMTNWLMQATGSRELDDVKLSKKDERELRDLMPTDENLLDTCEQAVS